jgi:hypothetical protein
MARLEKFKQETEEFKIQQSEKNSQLSQKIKLKIPEETKSQEVKSAKILSNKKATVEKISEESDVSKWL